MPQPLILVTNDDGYLAPGLAALVEAVQPLGEVCVVAPDAERSGCSHAITLHSHLRATPVREGWWTVSGTPVDCVYLGALHLCPRAPDLVLSGVNPGFNLGTDVFYSGTVGGAIEGYVRGARSAAISTHREADPRGTIPVVRRIAEALLAAGEHPLLNVNIPETIDPGRLRFRVTRLGPRPYLDRVERRMDPQGRPYFWIGGPPAESDPRDGEDSHAVAHGRISVTPLQLDLTASDLEGTRRLFAAGELEAS